MNAKRLMWETKKLQLKKTYKKMEQNIKIVFDTRQFFDLIKTVGVHVTHATPEFYEPARPTQSTSKFGLRTHATHATYDF